MLLKPIPGFITGSMSRIRDEGLLFLFFRSPVNLNRAYVHTNYYFHGVLLKT